MTPDEILNYFEKLSDDELIEMTNELQFVNLPENSKLRKAAKVIYEKENNGITHLLMLAVPISKVLANRLTAAKYVISHTKLD